MPKKTNKSVRPIVSGSITNAWIYSYSIYGAFGGACHGWPDPFLDYAVAALKISLDNAGIPCRAEFGSNGFKRLAISCRRRGEKTAWLRAWDPSFARPVGPVSKRMLSVYYYPKGKDVACGGVFDEKAVLEIALRER